MEKRHKVNRRDRARNRFSVRLPCKVWGYDEQRKASFQCWARLKHVSIQYPNHWLASSLVNPRTSSCGSNRVTWTQAEFITCVDDFPELSNLNDELKLVLRSLQWLQSLRKQKQSLLARWRWRLQPRGVDSYAPGRNPPARATASYVFAATDWVNQQTGQEGERSQCSDLMAVRKTETNLNPEEQQFLDSGAGRARGYINEDQHEPLAAGLRQCGVFCIWHYSGRQGCFAHESSHGCKKNRPHLSLVKTTDDLKWCFSK